MLTASLDQMPDPEPIDGSPPQAAADWHELAKHAPDADDKQRLDYLRHLGRLYRHVYGGRLTRRSGPRR